MLLVIWVCVLPCRAAQPPQRPGSRLHQTYAAGSQLRSSRWLAPATDFAFLLLIQLENVGSCDAVVGRRQDDGWRQSERIHATCSTRKKKSNMYLVHATYVQQALCTYFVRTSVNKEQCVNVLLLLLVRV